MPAHALAERIATWPWAEVATLLVGFAWGAMLGSFVNVVVHRLPRGESVVTARSRCPRCRSAIRPRDNVPVLGWLWLGGRCRDCGATIAATYPVVEAACGCAVMLLAAAELVGGGRWLPGPAGAQPPGIDRLLRGDWQLLAVFLLHAAIVLTVVAWSLLDRAGWRLPGREPAAAVMLAVTAVFLLPAAAPPAAWLGGSIPLPTGVWSSRLMTSLAGVLAGRLAAALAAWPAHGPAPRQGIWWGLPLLGSVLGWQGVTVVAIGAAVATRAGRDVAAGGLWLAAAGTLGLAFLGPLQRAWEGLFRAGM